jgi:hypothetical protein
MAPQIPVDKPERWIEMRRRLEASPERVLRAWSDPEELARWFPLQVEGGLAVGARSTLVWPDRRIWWDVIEVARTRFAVKLPGGADERFVTILTVDVVRAGYGTNLLLRHGPFPLSEPGALDAWAGAIESWAEALMLLRAHLDFSVDLRPR